MPARTPTVAQRRRQALITAVALVMIGVVVAITWLIDHSGEPGSPTAGQTTTAHTAPHTTGPHTTGPRTTGTTTSPPSTAPSNAVPARVTRTLALIDAGDWPPADSPGTRGGTSFGNNEGHLPRTNASGTRIAYREWDVNRKKSGQGRDAERIVTGSDGSAWYTADHYNTFILIRGPT
ncbi:ribonuclease domain-containing protein [Gordonia sp. NPDC003425]